MWVLTSFGVLMPALRHKRDMTPGDNRVIQVRARRRKDLNILRTEYMGDELGPTVTGGGTDYQFRAFCTREAWATALAKMAMDIDYTSFKDTTESKYGDKPLHDAYLSVWGTLLRTLSSRTGPQSPYMRWTTSSQSRSLARSDARHRYDDEQEHARYAREREDDWATLFDSVDTTDVDALTSGPDMRPNGTLDHASCDHGTSRNARRRCRTAWKRAHR